MRRRLNEQRDRSQGLKPTPQPDHRGSRGTRKSQPTPAPRSNSNIRVLAGVLGILFGGLGIHRFILGDVLGGVLRIIITCVTCGFGWLLGFVEGIIYLTKSDEEFIATYVDGDKSWF
jgi:TM2 domain-containing membrane protein YozV